MKKTIKKAQIASKKTLAERIHNSNGGSGMFHSFNKGQIEGIIDKLLEEIDKALINGEEVRFPTHFTLKTAITKARTGMNLQTKKKMIIPSKRVPKAKFSVDLKEQIIKNKI